MLTLIALAMAAALQSAPATDEGREPYAACLWDTVDRLEPSGEPARMVVDASFTACRPLEPQPTPGSRLASMSPEGQATVLSTFRALATEDLILRVTRVRACRNTAGCRIADLEPSP